MALARWSVVLGIVARGAASPLATSVPRRVAAGETVTLAGATLEVPAAWWVAEDRDMLTIQDLDRQLRIVIVAAAGQPARDAIAAAWRRTTPGLRSRPRSRNLPRDRSLVFVTGSLTGASSHVSPRR